MLLTRSTVRVLETFSFSKHAVLLSTLGETPSKAKKKKSVEVRINLIESSNLTVMSKDSALKLANRRNLQLCPVNQPAHWMTTGNRQAFELLSAAKKVVSNEDSQVKDKGFKGIKHAMFSASIQEHDIATKLRQLIKWVKSENVIEIAIDVSDRSDELRSRIEEALKDLVKLPEPRNNFQSGRNPAKVFGKLNKGATDIR